MPFLPPFEKCLLPSDVPDIPSFMQPKPTLPPTEEDLAVPEAEGLSAARHDLEITLAGKTSAPAIDESLLGAPSAGYFQAINQPRLLTPSDRTPTDRTPISKNNDDDIPPVLKTDDIPTVIDLLPESEPSPSGTIVLTSPVNIPSPLPLQTGEQPFLLIPDTAVIDVVPTSDNTDDTTYTSGDTIPALLPSYDLAMPSTSQLTPSEQFPTFTEKDSHGFRSFELTSTIATLQIHNDNLDRLIGDKLHINEDPSDWHLMVNKDGIDLETEIKKIFDSLFQIQVKLISYYTDIFPSRNSIDEDLEEAYKQVGKYIKLIQLVFKSLNIKNITNNEVRDLIASFLGQAHFPNEQLFGPEFLFIHFINKRQKDGRKLFVKGINTDERSLSTRHPKIPQEVIDYIAKECCNIPPASEDSFPNDVTEDGDPDDSLFGDDFEHTVV